MGTIVIVIIVDRVSRKGLLGIAFLAYGVCFIGIAIIASFKIKTAGVAFGCIVFLIWLTQFIRTGAIAPMVYILLADYVPDKAMTIVMFLIYIMEISEAMFFPVAVKKIGIMACFMFFGISQFFAFVFLHNFVYESKGKT